MVRDTQPRWLKMHDYKKVEIAEIILWENIISEKIAYEVSSCCPQQGINRGDPAKWLETIVKKKNLILQFKDIN